MNNDQKPIDIKVVVNCTKKVEFLFFHHHHYDVTFDSPNYQWHFTKLSTQEMVDNLRNMKREIEQIDDNSIVNFNYIYQYKNTAVSESLTHSTGKNAKEVFKSYLRERLYGIKDKYLDNADLYQTKHSLQK